MTRKQRKLSKSTKEKISLALSGRKKTDEHKAKISNSMKKYWDTIPYENNESNTEENEQKID